MPPAPVKQEEPKEKESQSIDQQAEITPPTAKNESMDAPKETLQTPPANNGNTRNQA